MFVVPPPILWGNQGGPGLVLCERRTPPLFRAYFALLLQRGHHPNSLSGQKKVFRAFEKSPPPLGKSITVYTYIYISVTIFQLSMTQCGGGEELSLVSCCDTSGPETVSTNVDHFRFRSVILCTGFTRERPLIFEKM